MSKPMLDQHCAGCGAKWIHYPTIKIPSGEIDDSRFPVIAFTYNRYCFTCAKAMFIEPKPDRRWWQFWRWFEKDKWAEIREEYGLKLLALEDLENIYGG